MYAKIENNIIVQYPVTFMQIRKEFPSVSFPIDVNDELLKIYGYVIVHEVIKPDDQLNEKVIEKEPTNINGKWYQNFYYTQLSQDEKDEKYANLSQEIRDTRNRLLYESDWTQLNDSPVNKEIWADYRTKLRDITSQPSFPASVIWPQKPLK